jgi:DNA-binding transcriptional LysR family regulator
MFVNQNATIDVMSKFDQIAAFIAVIEENGFAAAARKQQVSTAAISRQVARLELELKTQLIRRTTRQVALTEIGSRYYQQAKKALDELCEAELAIADSQTTATGLLTVTSNRYFAIQHLLPRLPEFMALNPQLKVNLELAERFPDLAQEGIDLIFGVSIEGPLQLVRKRVADTRYVLCAAPSYLEQYGVPHSPADLNKHSYITHSMRKPDNVLVFKGSKEIQIKPVLWLNDSQAMCDCAIAGMGIVKLHDYIVADAIHAGHLVAILSEFQEVEQPVYLYYQQNRYLQPKIRRFIDFYT